MNDKRYMDFALSIAQESKCVSRKVGAVFVKDGYVIGHGYNGTPSGYVNCCDADHNGDHHEWSKRNEIHAEINAILSVARSHNSIVGSTLYTTLSPCSDCSKALANIGLKRIVYLEEYDRNNENWRDLLTGVNVERYKEN